MVGISGSDAEASFIEDGCPALIVETFGEYAEVACAKSYCESKWDESATGSHGERGWFQIHPSWGWRSSYDPIINVAFAFELSQGGRNWSSWSC